MYKEFIDIKFGDKWASDFNLVVVSSGDRYSPPVYGNVNSNTSTVMGKRGVYKWKTQYNEKIFSVNMAFDNLNSKDINQIKKWLNPSKIQKLFFSDEPYKFYYASVNAEPSFSFLPFFEKRTSSTKTITDAIYKGELNLEFVAIDNYGYSEYGNFTKVEIEKDKRYDEDETFSTVMPWVQQSNLLNTGKYAEAAQIYSASFFDQDTGETTNGLGEDEYHRFYLLNSGNNNAKLNLSFDLVLPDENYNLVIGVKKVKKGNGTTWIDCGEMNAIVLTSFKDYIPFINFLGETDYNNLIGEDATKKKELMGKYKIEIDSELRDVYLKERNNEERVLSLNKFNDNRGFLSLYECNFIDYSKPFPTLEVEGVIKPTEIVYKNTAIEDTYFNEVFVMETDKHYRLVNVNFDWKHTYN